MVCNHGDDTGVLVYRALSTVNLMLVLAVLPLM